MSSLIGNAEAISQQVSQNEAIGCFITLMILGFILLFLLFFTLRHEARNKPSI